MSVLSTEQEPNKTAVDRNKVEKNKNLCIKKAGKKQYISTQTVIVGCCEWFSFFSTLLLSQMSSIIKHYFEV